MKAMDIGIGAHYPGHIGDWKNDPAGVWRDTVECLREIQSIAREEGVSLAPEIHSATPFEQPDEARRLLREILAAAQSGGVAPAVERKVGGRLETAELGDRGQEVDVLNASTNFS